MTGAADDIGETAIGPASVAWAADAKAVLDARRAERIAAAANDEEQFVHPMEPGGEPKFCHYCWLAATPGADEPPPIDDDEDDLVRDEDVS